MTGGTGFIGQNLIPYLTERGQKCDNLSRDQLKDKINIGKCNTVVHIAGLAHDTKNSLDVIAYYKVNYELTKKIFDAFLISESDKFIFISSVKAAADKVEGILTEDVLPNPETIYGHSKLLAENYLQDQVLPEGKSLYILRPCMIHGPSNKGNLNLLFKVVKIGIPYFLAAFSNKRSLVSIENFCFIINELIARDGIPSGIYNIADDEPISTIEMVSILAEALNKKAQLWRLSPKGIKLLAKMGDILSLPFTTEKLNKLTENYVVSNLKIRAAIKKPLPVTTRDGLRYTASMFTGKSFDYDLKLSY